MVAIAIIFSSLFVISSINLKTYFWMNICITPSPLSMYDSAGILQRTNTIKIRYMRQPCCANAGTLLRTQNGSTHLETPPSNAPGMKQASRICQPSPNFYFSYILAVHSGVPEASLLQVPMTISWINGITWVPHIQNPPSSFLFLIVVHCEPHPSPL